MIVELAGLSPAARYQWMTQAVIPRPVAWVLSENAGGDFNLAPFSYFNALASAPPLVGVSFGLRDDGSDKDSLVNIRERGFFVAHVASMGLLGELNESAASLPYGESEVSRQGLELAPLADGFPLPRLRDAPLALGCRLHGVHVLGEAQSLVIGEVLFLYADDAVMGEDERGRQVIDAKKVDPVARLSAGRYAGLADVVSLKRPA